MKNRLIAFRIFSVVVAFSVLSTVTQAQKPNVLFISIDDLNDWTGPQGGHPQAITPNVDRLAGQGFQLSDAHCSQAVCTASRNSIFSGLHTSTTEWCGSISAVRKSYDDVMGDHKMLPQYFKDNGYEILAVGKIFHGGVSDYKERTDGFWDETASDCKVPKELKARGEGYGGTEFYPFPKEGSLIIDRYGTGFDDGNSLCWGALEREDMPGREMVS